jgi:hypothetical protein
VLVGGSQEGRGRRCSPHRGQEGETEAWTWANNEGIGNNGDDLIGAPIGTRRREAWGTNGHDVKARMGHSFHRAEKVRRCEVGEGFDRR